MMTNLNNPNLPNISEFPHISAILPSDIIIDIFTRLPVKSLSKFKCCSKSMYALLHNPKFIKKHIDKTIQISNPNLILQLGFKLYVVDDKEWSTAKRIPVPFAFSLENFELSGSCNGLLCLSDHTLDEDIYLHNPCTGIYKKLPLPKFDICKNGASCFTSLGFGYLNSEYDFKVIRCVYLYDSDSCIGVGSDRCEAGVYSLKTDTWKKIGPIPFQISTHVAVWFGGNFLVWVAFRGSRRRDMVFFVVSFNMVSEKFEEIPQPENIDGREDCQIDVSVLNNNFTMFRIWRNQRVEIWSMKEFGVKESWVKLFDIGRPSIMADHHFFNLRPLCMRKENGVILMERGEGDLILYDHENGIVSDFVIQGAPRWFSVIPWVSSLASPLVN